MRKGIAMIELIFAIVVMGIVMLSAPLLISKATESTYVGLQQESIAAAAAHMNIILASEWDQLDTNLTESAPVLRTGSATVIPCTGATILPGVTSTSGRDCNGTSTLNPYTATLPVNLGSDFAIDGILYNDIDDYDNTSFTMSIYNNEFFSTSAGNYIDTDINVSTTVSYGDDLPRNRTGAIAPNGYAQTTAFHNPFRNVINANSTNIKYITVVLTSNSNGPLSSKQILLSAFMCNIGAPNNILISN